MVLGQLPYYIALDWRRKQVGICLVTSGSCSMLQLALISWRVADCGQRLGMLCKNSRFQSDN